jgi:hypothetical protein
MLSMDGAPVRRRCHPLKMDDDAVLRRIHDALLDEALDGIGLTAGVYGFGAFQLAGALLDTVSCLASGRGTRAARAARFIVAYFPAAYHRDDLPRQLYEDLRCRPLHNYSTIRLLLMDGQDEALHLTDYRGRTIIRLQDLLGDLRVALGRWWQDVETDETHRRSVLAEQRQRPVVEVETIETGLTLPASLPAQFPPGASAYGAVVASGGVLAIQQRDGNG